MNKQELNQLIEKIETCESIEELNNMRISYLGRKGQINEMWKDIKSESVDEKKIIGQKINHIKAEINTVLIKKHIELEKSKQHKELLGETIDISANYSKIRTGSTHFVQNVVNEIITFFKQIGYVIDEGPEIENEDNNFNYLNIPPEHPSRDTFDTFFLKNSKNLLRTHTTNVTSRILKASPNSGTIASISLGNVYRKDKDDASHTHQFTQIDGFFVNQKASMSNLFWTLNTLCKIIFGKDTKIKFVPSFFPFTCPSTELNVACWKCLGNSDTCTLCKGTGWIEILGAGMIHPRVLRNCGWNSEIYKGFAFGIGVERVTMLKYSIPDIRYFFSNNIKFLEQF